ncbi:ATP-binding protein [Maribacter sp. X9]|uniref:ATP-binding protein n=1 Tax=Maribacter sp. X9 TaxID=3402159 RepID=UPI003AF33AD6
MSQQLLSELENLAAKFPDTDENKSLLQSLKLKILEKGPDLDMLSNYLSEGYSKCELICDSDGIPIDYRFITVNQKFKEHSGLENQDIIGKTILEIFPDIEKSWIDFYGEVAMTQKSNSISHYNHNTKKHYLASAFSHKKGEFIAIFQDITKDVQLKEERRKKVASLKFNADILDNMGCCFAHGEIIYDVSERPYDMRILQANTAFHIQIGVDSDSVIGRNLHEFFPDLKQYWLDNIVEVATLQVPKTFVSYSELYGKYYDVNAYSPQKGQVIIIFKDITKLEEQKIKLRESESIKSKIIENMLDGFILSEIICNENNDPIDYRVLSVNPAFEKQTGIKAKEIVGKTMLEFFPDVEEAWIKMVGQVGLTQQPTSTTQYNHNTKKHYEINAYSPMRGQVVKIFRDITSKENKREQLEKAYKKAEENERLKSAFLANMSHEIRTPMNGILGCTALLENEGLEIEERQKCLDYIKSSGNRLMRLISDIVDLSKIDAFEQELRISDHNLNNIMDTILYQFKVSHKNPEVQFTLKKEFPNTNFTIRTDDVRLTQIITNLLENAFKFTNQGYVEFGYRLVNGQLLFHVRDTGIGIRPKDQKLIFRRFGQVIDADTKMNQGTGLGTSIAKGLVMLFGGKIWLESEFGKGSTFHFSIPYLAAN